jgi:two-component system sensor histidine kinase KdpD
MIKILTERAVCPVDFLKIFTLRWPEKWMRRRRFFSEEITYSFRDILVTLILFAFTVVLCLMLRSMDPHNDTSYVAVIFFMDVFLTALLTEGYLFGVIAAVGGVLCVDYIFTAPYWQISFTLAGFPLTFLVMMTISLITCMLTTRVKQAESLRREAEREKIHANLLRAVSHDIRTPLTGIVGATDALLESTALTETEKQTLLQGANEDARWLIRVVENLLSITRIGANNAAPLVKAPGIVEEVIESAVAKFSRKPTLPVEVVLPEEVLVAPMDELLMEQVLLNLMENAVRHGETATKITVSLTCDRKTVRITVCDDGTGISPQLLPRLFDSSTHQSKQGDAKRDMGIGLSVCHTIVKAHQGAMEVRNVDSGGAEFRVLLPLEEKCDE